ncbi:MAG TPA: hypothetical protein VKA84_04395 [Gemmatimonadaceae bacterium]|nr:hypothetical protein [Gemmatimonadaceae bacterium]
MAAANPTHPTKARLAGTQVRPGERLTHVVRRVEDVRAQSGRGYCRPSELRRDAQGVSPWSFTAIELTTNEHPLATEALRAIGGSRRGTRSGSSLLPATPATPVSARRADAKDGRAQSGAGGSAGGTP